MTAGTGEPVECSPGDSAEQRAAELELVAAFAASEGVVLFPRQFSIADGVRVHVDAADEDQSVLCEVWAHIGPPKSAQKQKVMSDALKLLLVEKHLERRCRKVLLFADVDARRRFTGKNWMAEALRQFGIELALAPLSEDGRQQVLKAQKRQFR